MTARASQSAAEVVPVRVRAALTACVLAAAVAAAAPHAGAATIDADAAPHDPDAVPRLWDPRTRASAPRFFDANGSAPEARVPRLWNANGGGRVRAADVGYSHPWAKRVRAATAYARARQGRVAYAVVDDRGKLRGHLVDQAHRSASVVKAMFLVAYLNSGPVRGRPLRRADRRLLRPMILWSDNGAATRVLGAVGARGVNRVAERAGMKRFALAPRWGDSTITPADQARFFARIDALVVERHRAYARRLLAGIVPEQRWGIPRALPEGWRAFFKGGWRPLGDRNLVNQVALLEAGERRVALAVLTDGNPSHVYGTETVRGVARRLLRGLR